MNEALRQKISELVATNDVVLFMKGNRHFPQCGFSAQVVGILNELVPKYETVNVLSDPEIRDGIKEFSSWPTIPQLYVKGTFVGGCDIVKEMHASGELEKLLGVARAAAKTPAITMTESAARAFKSAAGEAGDDVLRMEINAEFQPDLYFGPNAAGDVVVQTASGVAVHLDASSARRADGVSIDFVDRDGGGFKIDNPNEPPRVRSIGARELRALLDKGVPLELLDVRPETERAIAKIAAARPLDAQAEKHLATLDKKTMLVFHCHHGVRSRSAAEHFLSEGFTSVFNLEGGIEAWSAAVDPDVPRY